MQSKRTNSKMPRSKAIRKLIAQHSVKGIARSVLIRRMSMARLFSKEDLANIYFGQIENLFPRTTVLLKEILEEIPQARLPLFLEGAFPALRSIIVQRLQGNDKGGPNA